MESGPILGIRDTALRQSLLSLSFVSEMTQMSSLLCVVLGVRVLRRRKHYGGWSMTGWGQLPREEDFCINSGEPWACLQDVVHEAGTTHTNVLGWELG